MDTIEHFTAEDLNALRAAYRDAGLPANPLRLATCSDAALLQVAEAGIRALSWTAICFCWKRGLRVFQKR